MAIMSKPQPFTLCVFCGSSPGVSPRYLEATSDLANLMHANQWSLVYGGGSRGLMGALAKTLVQLSSPKAVTGIIPSALLPSERGLVTPEETEYGQTRVVSSMHERKMMMVQQANAFVALPGGFGTMEELFEITTWSQLGIHDQPIVMFNVDGFFDHLLAWLDKAVEQGFIGKDQIGILRVADTAQGVIDEIKSYQSASGRHTLDWSKDPVPS